MLQEQPLLFFVHFWANDDAMKRAMSGVGQDGGGSQLGVGNFNDSVQRALEPRYPGQGYNDL
jgi:hypothetical protein